MRFRNIIILLLLFSVFIIPAAAFLDDSDPLRKSDVVVLFLGPERSERSREVFQLMKEGHADNLNYTKGRDYTICSSIHDDYLEFLIKRVKNGEISTYLAALQPGEQVEMVGPYGDFSITDDPGKKYLFVATGVGVGPFLSFVKSYPNLDYTLVHGVRFDEDLVLADGIESERYISCISRGEKGAYKGRVTDLLKEYHISKYSRCCICGNPYMLKIVHELCLQRGFSEDDIQRESYYAY